MDTRIDPAKVARFLGAWRSQTLPDYRALAHGLTSLIDGSLLPAAHVLPSQRRLASALGVARGTVVRAYGILHESGRLEPRRGSGNYVARPRAVGSDASCPSRTAPPPSTYPPGPCRATNSSPRR